MSKDQSRPSMGGCPLHSLFYHPWTQCLDELSMSSFSPIAQKLVVSNRYTMIHLLIPPLKDAQVVSSFCFCKQDRSECPCSCLFGWLGKCISRVEPESDCWVIGQAWLHFVWTLPYCILKSPFNLSFLSRFLQELSLIAPARVAQALRLCFPWMVFLNCLHVCLPTRLQTHLIFLKRSYLHQVQSLHPTYVLPPTTSQYC